MVSLCGLNKYFICTPLVYLHSFGWCVRIVIVLESQSPTK